jgi:hypothetical protein
MKQRIWMVLAGLAVLGGLFFAGVCINYLLSYFAEPGNPIRQEYLQGAAIAIMLSIPFWLVASGAIFKIRAVVPRMVFLSINTITGIVCVLFLLANIYPLIMGNLGK